MFRREKGAKERSQTTQAVSKEKKTLSQRKGTEAGRSVDGGIGGGVEKPDDGCGIEGFGWEERGQEDDEWKGHNKRGGWGTSGDGMGTTVDG